jgi:FkbM family methyltransferase
MASSSKDDLAGGARRAPAAPQSRMTRAWSVLRSVAADPRRAARLQQSTGEATRALDLQRRVDSGDPWGVARLMAEMPRRERHLLGAALLQDADALLMLERGETTWFVQPSLDVIVSDLIEYGRYEPQELEAVLTYALRHRPPEAFPVIVDVGANIGTTTVPFAQRGYRVVAIEPVPHTVQLLRMNLAANRVTDRCIVVEQAVADRSGEVMMRVQNTLGISEVIAHGHTETDQVTGDYRNEQIQVPAAPLEQILGDAGIDPGEVALVWSDTEGSEATTVGTGGPLWDAGVPLWIEVSAHTLDLHDALRDFMSRSMASFSSFVTRESLFAEPTTPDSTTIGSLPDIVHASGSSRWEFTNILLLP